MFLLNLEGKISIYEQIRQQIARFIKLGVLKADDKLPSVRYLANDLGINPNTVLKAYQELEKQGFIYTIPKKGVFVAKDQSVNEELLKEEFTQTVRKYRQLGFKADELTTLVREVYIDAGN